MAGLPQNIEFMRDELGTLYYLTQLGERINVSLYKPGEAPVIASQDLTGGVRLSAGAYQNAEKLLRCMRFGRDPYADATGITVTVGTANASTVIAGSVLIEPDDPRIWPSQPAVRGAIYPANLFTTQKYTDYAAAGQAPSLTCLTSKNTFQTDSTDFEIMLLGQGQETLVFIGGKRCAFTLPADGGLYLVRFQITGSNQLREVCVQTPGSFGGVRQLPVRSFAAPAREQLRVLFFGDSVTEGSVAAYTSRAYAARLHNLFGATHGGLDAVGSTGYVVNNSGTRKAIPERLDSTLALGAPDVCIWAAGLNDSASPVASIQTALAGCLQKAKAANPGVLNIVLGPFQPRSMSTLGDTNAAISAAARAEGAVFIDNIAQKEITGTGKVGSTVNDGNSDWAISSDGVHPTDAVHAYIADWRYAAILRALSA